MALHIKTFTTFGLQGSEVVVEIDSSNALPTLEVVGLPDTAVKEAKERIKGTMRALGIQLPPRRFIINLAPSDTKKTGTSFDVAMALALASLVSDGAQYHEDLLKSALFFGELGLDGSVKRIKGLLPAVLAAYKAGYRHFFVPAENAYELQYLKGIVYYPMRHFEQIWSFFNKNTKMNSRLVKQEYVDTAESVNNGEFEYIKGQAFAKRALTIGAAGLHNILLVGPPGSGKTMLSRALRSILPPMSFEEILEVSQIYSVVGKLTKEQPLVVSRPFRHVHHTASRVSIVGGGQQLLPGEMSLAHRGILFFDEIAEFPREVLEVLRQPLEDKNITISRVTGTVQYPSQVMFVGSMNPCKCGYFQDPKKPCVCTQLDVQRYQSKISGPLLDRMDLILQVPRESLSKLIHGDEQETTQQLRERVLKARDRQRTRYALTDITANSHLTAQTLHQYVVLSHGAQKMLDDRGRLYDFSGRALHRMLKLARTIADIGDSELVQENHLAEAYQYRCERIFGR